MLSINPDYRVYNQGINFKDQVRAQGWAFRTHAYLTSIIPDNHPMKAYITERFKNRIRFYINNYVKRNTTGALDKSELKG
jgi:hypothetical protein